MSNDYDLVEAYREQERLQMKSAQQTLEKIVTEMAEALPPPPVPPPSPPQRFVSFESLLRTGRAAKQSGRTLTLHLAGDDPRKIIIRYVNGAAARAGKVIIERDLRTATSEQEYNAKINQVANMVAGMSLRNSILDKMENDSEAFARDHPELAAKLASVQVGCQVVEDVDEGECGQPGVGATSEGLRYCANHATLFQSRGE